MIDKLAKIAAAKLVGLVVGVAIALGVALPADLTAQLTAGLTAVIVLVLQVGYQAAAEWLSKHVPSFARRRVLVVRRR